MFLIATLPTYLIRFKILGIPSTLSEVMILIVFAVWLIKNFKNIITNLKYKISNTKYKIIPYPFAVEMITLLIISFVSAGVAGFTNEALGAWKAYFFEPILLFIVMINIFKKEDIKKILWPLAVSAFVIALFAVYQKFTGAWIANEFWAAEPTRRVVSFFGYPNAVALYLEAIIFLTIGWTANQLSIINYQLTIKKKLKIIFIFLIIIVSLLAVVFAKSVGGAIGIGAGLIFFGMLVSKKSRITTAGVLLLILISIFSFTTTRNLAIKYLTLNDFSGQVRRLQWEETWAMLKDGRIITGAGLANYQKVIKPYHVDGFFYNKNNSPDFRMKIVWGGDYYKKKYWQPLEIYLYPHNIFLNFWSELGLAGMLIFIWIIIKFYYLGFKMLRTAENKFLIIGLLSAMTAIVVHGLVDVPYFKNDLAAIFWILIIMLCLIDLRTEEPNLKS
jgi:O-antigen ligase